MAAAASTSGADRNGEAAGRSGVAASHSASVAAVRRLPSHMHSFDVLGVRFDVDKRFQFVRPVGQGSYGVVSSCFDQQMGIRVAIKKIPNAFEDVQDVKRLLREVRMLRAFDHENIIGLRNLLRPHGNNTFDQLYIVTELMDSDLYQIISSKQELTTDHHQYFLYQLLRGLKFLHSADVMHRDLKPSNLLVNENCHLKIADFGLARLTYADEDLLQDNYTQYVVTRWYRAPELLLCAKDYTNAVDMWSVGCILAELIGRRPLFPGKDYFHQLCLVTDVIGTSQAHSSISMIIDESAQSFLRKIPYKACVPLSDIYPTASPTCVDLLGRMLMLSPKRRIKIEDAICHPYLSSLHDATDEPIAALDFDSEFEKIDSLIELQDLVLKELLTFDSKTVHQRSGAPLRRQIGADDNDLQSDTFDTS